MTNDSTIQSILYQVAYDVALDYQTELRNQGISATGALANVDFEVTIGENSYGISLILQDYWKNVEYGRRPGKFPNLTKLQEWIQVRQILPRPMANGKLPTEKQLTFMIGNHIKENGIPARPVLANTLEKNKDVINKIKDAVALGFDKEIKKMLKELNN